MEDRYKETFKSWDKAAKLYQEHFMNLDLYNNGYNELCGFLKPDARVLEIGTGPGNIAKYLLNKRPDIKLLGIDVSPRMLELAKENNPNAEFLEKDCRNLGELSGEYDAVVSGFTIPYLNKEDCKKLLEDCKKLSSPQAHLYLSYVEGAYSKSAFITGSNGDRVYFYYYSSSYLLHMLKAQGFNILKKYVVPYTKSDGETEEHVALIMTKGLSF